MNILYLHNEGEMYKRSQKFFFFLFIVEVVYAHLRNSVTYKMYRK